ncbi:hypothetical protein [Ferrovibrio sp.]|uniref:hypothetical protein n=1 Tax=Ferrovibrio sp. TaxID=1917215 RepID=UPI00311D537C
MNQTGQQDSGRQDSDGQVPDGQDLAQDGLAAGAQELQAFGWEAAEIALPPGSGASGSGASGSGATAVSGFRRGDFAVYGADGVWQVVALPAQLLLGRLPTASAVRRFAAKCVSFPAQPNGAVIGTARQAMLQAVEEELSTARHAAQQIEGRIDDLMASIDDIRAKAILFSHDD